MTAVLVRPSSGKKTYNLGGKAKKKPTATGVLVLPHLNMLAKIHFENVYIVCLHSGWIQGDMSDEKPQREKTARKIK